MTISPFSRSASRTASSVFPEQVGPTIMTIFCFPLSFTNHCLLNIFSISASPSLRITGRPWGQLLENSAASILRRRAAISGMAREWLPRTTLWQAIRARTSSWMSLKVPLLPSPSSSSMMSRSVRQAIPLRQKPRHTVQNPGGTAERFQLETEAGNLGGELPRWQPRGKRARCSGEKAVPVIQPSLQRNRPSVARRQLCSWAACWSISTRSFPSWHRI